MQPFFKPFIQSLPTIFGQAIGKASQRVMLDAVGGPNGIRKKFIVNADGSKTMLTTRAGMPEFITTPAITTGT